MSAICDGLSPKLCGPMLQAELNADNGPKLLKRERELTVEVCFLF